VTSGGNNFNDFAENQLTEFRVTQKTSSPGQIQDTVKSRTGPRNKGQSWKIQDEWSPYVSVTANTVYTKKLRERLCWLSGGYYKKVFIYTLIFV